MALLPPFSQQLWLPPAALQGRIHYEQPASAAARFHHWPQHDALQARPTAAHTCSALLCSLMFTSLALPAWFASAGSTACSRSSMLQSSTRSRCTATGRPLPGAIPVFKSCDQPTSSVTSSTTMQQPRWAAACGGDGRGNRWPAAGGGVAQAGLPCCMQDMLTGQQAPCCMQDMLTAQQAATRFVLLSHSEDRLKQAPMQQLAFSCPTPVSSASSARSRDSPSCLPVWAGPCRSPCPQPIAGLGRL